MSKWPSSTVLSLLLERWPVQFADSMAKVRKTSVFLFTAWMQLLSHLHDHMEISALKYFFLHYLAVQIPASAALSYRPSTCRL